MCKTFQLYFLLLIFLFSFMIAEQSTDNEKLFKQGITFERMGKFELAENIYLELLNSDPKNSRFYFQLKSLYKRNNSYLKLEKLLENRIKLFPKDFQTKVEIGDIYFKSNNKEKAIGYWDDLLFEFKSNKTIYYLLFQIFSANKLDKKLSSIVEKGRLQFNEPNFLSYELGNYKSAKLDFYGSIQEYLKFLKTNPNQLNIISSKILVFSDDSKNKNIIEKSFDDFFIKNNKINNKVIVHVFIDFLLKTKNYSEALNQLFFLPLDDENDYQFQINFANNLRNEKEIEASIQVYSNILTSLKSENQLLQKSLSKLTGKILYGIALSYEQKIKPDIETKLISGLFSNNFFFQSKIFVNKNFSSNLINETFNMYDSILIKTNENDFSSQAHYRIGELRYLINNDFQGAINSYKSASNNDNRNISLKSNLRISDVYFTSGEINKSIFHLENMIQNSNFDSKEKELIKINLIKKYFLNGELDKCEFILSELILSIKYEDKFFNDLIELKRYIDKHFSKNDDYNKSAFLNYLIGEKYLAQNKIVESISFFQKVLDDYDKTSIIPETTFRLAQIMDKNLDDKIQAEKLYFQFLEDFPKSIYTEPIRFRLRQIKGEEF